MITNPLVLFDGKCNLCNGTVDFLIRKDSRKQLRFIALQSKEGKKLKKKFNVPVENDSVILIFKGRIFLESEAVLKIAEFLPYPWRIAAGFRVIPASLRNRIYKWIAVNRYRLFGKKKHCRVPTPEEKKMFPDQNDLKL